MLCSARLHGGSGDRNGASVVLVAAVVAVTVAVVAFQLPIMKTRRKRRNKTMEEEKILTSATLLLLLPIMARTIAWSLKNPTTSRRSQEADRIIRSKSKPNSYGLINMHLVTFPIFYPTSGPTERFFVPSVNGTRTCSRRLRLLVLPHFPISDRMAETRVMTNHENTAITMRQTTRVRTTRILRVRARISVRTNSLVFCS
mmetsp:Transcript_11641/g.25228  ORF Transcript_11641/g.25228 Transcript_11641/m.25228 type:complete len:200 (+) Transcript_11641:1114-1713(+)